MAVLLRARMAGLMWSGMSELVWLGAILALAWCEIGSVLRCSQAKFVLVWPWVTLWLMPALHSEVV